MLSSEAPATRRRRWCTDQELQEARGQEQRQHHRLEADRKARPIGHDRARMRYSKELSGSTLVQVPTIQEATVGAVAACQPSSCDAVAKGKSLFLQASRVNDSARPQFAAAFGPNKGPDTDGTRSCIQSMMSPTSLTPTSKCVPCAHVP